MTVTRSSSSQIQSQAAKTADPSLLVSLARTAAETRAAEARVPRRRRSTEGQATPAEKKKSQGLAPLGHGANVIPSPQGNVRLETDSDVVAHSAAPLKPAAARPSSRPATPPSKVAGPASPAKTSSGSSGGKRQTSKGRKKQSKAQKRGSSSSSSSAGSSSTPASTRKKKPGKRRSSKQRK